MSFDGRPAWSISDEKAASYTLGGEWSALIRLTANPYRRLGRRVAGRAPAQRHCLPTRFASTLDQAVQLAERLVNG